MEEKMYCSACMKLIYTNECEDCGNENLRLVRAEDPVYITKQNTMFAGMLEDVFKQNNIPFITRALMGAGFTTLVGSALEEISFYVPMRLYDEASLLVEEIFGLAKDSQYKYEDSNIDDSEAE